MKKARINLDKKIKIMIPKNKKLSMDKIFGSLKDWKTPADKLMMEIDKDLYPGI